MSLLCFCDTCGYWYMIGLVAAGHDESSSAGQTTKCESVRRVNSMYLLWLFLPPETLSVRPCRAFSCWQTLLRKECSALLSWTSRWWKIHFCYWSHTLYNILLWKSHTLSVREGKSNAWWDNIFLLQECCDNQKRKDHMCIENVIWKNWNAHISLLDTMNEWRTICYLSSILRMKI